MSEISVGVIGLGNRGSSLLESMMACPECRITAVSDLYEDRRKKGIDIVVQHGEKAPKEYANWMDLVHDDDVKVVVIVCDWEMHIPMAIEAMKAHKIVASEVAGAYSIDDCWKLVDTYEETKTPIMLLENCCFDEFELLTTSLVRHGLLGDILYAHGCYGHDLRGEITGGNVNRHYRLRNYEHRNAENYPTHELGPIAKILDINRGNRFVRLASNGTRPGVGLEAFVKDSRCIDSTLSGQKFAQSDIVSTTLVTEKQQVVTIRLDTSLPRFYAREFTIRGTKGLAQGDQNLVCLDGSIPEIYETNRFYEKELNNANAYKERYQCDVWKNMTPEQRKLGHGGMDYIEFRVLFDCILKGKPLPIDVYDMATWMAITPLSTLSMEKGGVPVEFPDFTRGKYCERASQDVVELPK
ncbi:MAG: Gfo/Idh/MocA family oxidoreductase [Erysipelotrichaceae bacterium]|nr:Gfo/Idh/MocA family oxidoreductase [Erysipelotrichaceae bacterium]